MFQICDWKKDDIREAFAAQFLHNIKKLVFLTLPLSE